MTDCADLAAFDFSQNDAALALDEALRIIGTLEAACIPDQPDAAPLPRGLLSCGEAVRLIPLLVVLLLQKYPRLLDGGEFNAALQLVALDYVSGEPN